MKQTSLQPWFKPVITEIPKHPGYEAGYAEYNWPNVINFWMKDEKFHIASQTMPKGTTKERLKYAEILQTACEYMLNLGEEE
jgi:hypothetical protein